MTNRIEMAVECPDISSAPENSCLNLAYHFGEFVLDVDRGELTNAGRDLQLRPKSYAVLLYLIENHGRLVSRGELFESVWGDTIVTDGAVTQCLIEIRRALDDTEQSKIRTVPRRGYVFELPVERVDGIDRTRSKVNGVPGFISPRSIFATVLGVIVLSLVVWQLSGSSNDADQNIIAVLPFVDMSPKQDQQYFADGISDDILSQLKRVRGLRVIARTSSFAFKDSDKSIAEIAADLGVSHILQGSVRRVADRTRVAVQLIDAASSEQIWSESFDRKFTDVFEIQDQISASVVNRLELSFSDRPSRIRPLSAEAYSRYLRAVHVMDQGTTEHWELAESLLSDAVSIDPGLAPAWRELARLRWRIVGTGPSARETIDGIRDALNRSYALDPDDPATLAYMAASIADFDGDTDRAARLYERAITLNPADEHVLRTGIIFLTNYGDPADAIKLGEYGMLRNPVCYLCADNLWRAYLAGHQYEDAETLARSTLELHSRGHFRIGYTLLLQGRPEEALDWFSQESLAELQVAGKAMALHDLSRHTESEALLATFLDPTGAKVPQGIHVWALGWTGHTDAAFEVFERVIDRHQKYGGEVILRQLPWQMSRVARSPFLEPLRVDSRWGSLATQLEITDEQQADLNFSLSIATNL